MTTTAICYITPCDLAKSINISQKPAASIFRVRESPKHKKEDIDLWKISNFWAGI
jgi:hypothetical protein